MDNESLSVILPCWAMAIGLEILIVGAFINIAKRKK